MKENVKKLPKGDINKQNLFKCAYKNIWFKKFMLMEEISKSKQTV